MASVVYNQFKASNAAADIDLNGDAIYLALVMTNTTADTENDGMQYMDDFATLDEMDGANYSSSARQELDNIAVNLDDANDRAEFDADDETFSALGNGTRDIQGVVIHVDADDNGDTADDGANRVICFIDFAVDQSPGGSDFQIVWNAEGILQLA